MATKLVRKQREFMYDSDSNSSDSDTNNKNEDDDIDIDIEMSDTKNNIDIPTKPVSLIKNGNSSKKHENVIVISDDDDELDLICKTPLKSKNNNIDDNKENMNGNINGNVALSVPRKSTYNTSRNSKKRKFAELSTTDYDETIDIDTT